jgi:hypothetical protein
MASIERRTPTISTNGGEHAPAPQEPGSIAAPSPVEEAIARLTAGGDQGVSDDEFAALVAMLTVDREPSQRELIARLADPAQIDRPAAVRLLAEIATPASLEALRAAFAVAETRPAAAVGLARLEHTTRLVALIESERDAGIRGTLLSGLVERDDALAVAALLDRIADPARAEATLAAMAAARRPAVDHLFAVLTGSHVERRALAARALGRIDGPIVTRRLVALVLQGAYQHDALLALVGSRGVEAERFVALARHDDALTASVAWAEHQFAVLFPQQQKRLIP